MGFARQGRRRNCLAPALEKAPAAWRAARKKIERRREEENAPGPGGAAHPGSSSPSTSGSGAGGELPLLTICTEIACFRGFSLDFSSLRTSSGPFPVHACDCCLLCRWRGRAPKPRCGHSPPAAPSRSTGGQERAAGRTLPRRVPLPAARLSPRDGPALQGKGCLRERGAGGAAWSS